MRMLTPADKLAAFEISDNRTTNTDTFCQIGLTPTKKCACAPYLRSEFRKIMHGYSKKEYRAFQSGQYYFNTK
jgi:hypothetical protein